MGNKIAIGTAFKDQDLTGGTQTDCLYTNPTGFTAMASFGADGMVTLDGNVMATEAGTGITGGAGTIYKSSVLKTGSFIKTSIIIDLTDLQSSTTDLDIIGQSTTNAHIGQITAARNGTILSGLVTCHETPAGGADDIDLYSATVATGKFDDIVTGLVETELLNRAGAWAAGDIKHLTALPAANAYLYLTCGEAGTVGTYTAGRFLIELDGYVA